MIDHDGIIEHIRGDVAHVKINSVSACAACHAKGACGAADQEEKYLDIPLEGKEFSAGETVRVQVAKHLGFRAVALGYVLPFVILMAVLITLTAAGLDELKAGLFALLSLPLYYLGLYMARRKIESRFTFSIQKTQTVQ
ncbi:MAG: SoxR reducing system RseC family protein [Bacteroidota bacterium]